MNLNRNRQHDARPAVRRVVKILGTLFILPFLGVGAFMLVLAFRAFGDPKGGLSPPIAMAAGGLAFSGFALFALYWLRAGGRMAAALQEVQAREPDRPWLWREDWAHGRVESSGRRGLLFGWFFACLWNLISLPAALAVPAEVQKGNTIALLGLLFPAIGVLLLIWAVRATLRWRRYGASCFEMTTRPGVVGGTLQGTIQTRLGRAAAREIGLTLTCVRRTRSGSGKNSSTRETILWQEGVVLPVTSVGAGYRGASIPVSFTIPHDCRQTDGTNPNDSIRWLLRAQASVPGVDFEDTFEVPVFRTQDSSEQVGSAPAAPDPFQDGGFPASRRSRGIRVGPSPAGGVEFYFGAARNVKAAFGVTVFLAFWTGAIVLMIHLGAPILFPIVFGLFDLLLLIGVVDLWLGVSRMVVQGDRIQLRSGPLGIGRTRTVACSGITDVKLRIGMQSGGSAGTPFYDLILHLPDGKKLCAARHLRRKREAEWLASEIKRTIGLPRHHDGVHNGVSS